VRAGLAGTFPTFVIDERYVVKFFGRLFDGRASFAVERAVGRLLASETAIPAPALLCSGQLWPNDSDWPWPYLVYEFVPGVSIGEVFDRIGSADRHEIARYLGWITRRLHALVPTTGDVFKWKWDGYLDLLGSQRARCKRTHQAWGTLPTHLIDGLDEFILPPEALVDRGSPFHLIHADLTADHLLGELCDGRWVTTGIIDFGDAMVGNLAYELVALHLHLFGCDKRLLATYLNAYRVDDRFQKALPRVAMSVTLLHRFDVLAGLPPEILRDAPTLDHLAAVLWDLDSAT
jgi:Ser/Thr protein kinase RdoA (MazF antagonist)